MLDGTIRNDAMTHYDVFPASLSHAHALIRIK
jgi:hypothetical protein